MMTEILRVDAIRTDGGTQARAATDGPTAYEYADAMETGAVFPPIVVFHDGESYWLADGFHRLEAAKRNEYTEIACEIHQGTRREAVLFAASANASHGLRRNRQDIRRAVIGLLMDDEWRQWSDRKIADLCNCSHPLVGNIRAELVRTGKITSGETRKTADGREMNTEKIGTNQPTKAHEFAVGDRVKTRSGRLGVITSIGGRNAWVLTNFNHTHHHLDTLTFECKTEPSYAEGDIVRIRKTPSWDGSLAEVLSVAGEAVYVLAQKTRERYWVFENWITRADGDEIEEYRSEEMIIDLLTNLYGNGWMHGMHLGIRDVLDQFVSDGLIQDQEAFNEMGGRYLAYHITKAGCEYINRPPLRIAEHPSVVSPQPQSQLSQQQPGGVEKPVSRFAPMPDSRKVQAIAKVDDAIAALNMLSEWLKQEEKTALPVELQSDAEWLLEWMEDVVEMVCEYAPV